MAYILDKQETEFPLPNQAYENRELSQKYGIFFTNAILCLKEAYCERTLASGEKQITSCINERDVTGGQQLDVNGQWFHNCASNLLNTLINFLNTRIIVTMGNTH